MAKSTVSLKSTETRKQKWDRIADRFDLLGDFTTACTTGEVTALIGSGPPGLGKSHTAETLLAEWDPTGTMYTISKGYCLTTGLLKLLFKHREKGHVIVFDDCDTIFGDLNSTNLLKAVCDTCEERVVSYRCESRLVADDEATIIPDHFKFEGSIIFLTNMDFDEMIEKGNKMAEHLKALVSRAHYIDLTLKTVDDFLIRIEQVMNTGLLNKHLPKGQHKEVLNFLTSNARKLRELSLRMAIKVAQNKARFPKNWEEVCFITCCRN